MLKKFGIPKQPPPKRLKKIGEVPVVPDKQVPKALREAMNKKIMETYYRDGDGRKVTDLHPSEEVLKAIREQVAKTARALSNKGNGMRTPLTH